MKKIALTIAAFAAICFAVPASAQTVVISPGGMHRQHDGYGNRDRAYRARGEYRRHDRGHRRGYDRHHRRGPAVIIR